MLAPPLRTAMIGEDLGTALLVRLGESVVAGAVVLNEPSDTVMIITGWGLALARAGCLTGRLSGGHINPAVTLALAWRGGFLRSRRDPREDPATVLAPRC
jgi:glycerol uptake facilitator protein